MPGKEMEVESSNNEKVAFCPECGLKNVQFLDICSRCKTSFAKSQRITLQADIEDFREQARKSFNESLTPETLARFRNQMALDIEQRLYFQWRAIQPEWEAISRDS